MNKYYIIYMCGQFTCNISFCQLVLSHSITTWFRTPSCYMYIFIVQVSHKTFTTSKNANEAFILYPQSQKLIIAAFYPHNVFPECFSANNYA